METKFYKWWKGHRRVVTFGGFLILFAWYLSPFIQEAKYKNRCIRHLTKEFTINPTFGDDPESPLTTKEVAEAKAYMYCNHLGKE